MVENKTHGKIINVSSQAGRRGEALVSHYCATKAAIISYTQSAALALAKHSINVNGIAPGVIDTPMWDKVDSLFSKYEKRPLGDAKKRLENHAASPIATEVLEHFDITGAHCFGSVNKDFIEMFSAWGGKFNRYVGGFNHS